MNFEFAYIKFTEYPDEEYRLVVSESEGNKVSIWMENKKTKSQWVTELSEDIAKYGPVGPPLSALLHALQEAFSSLDQANKTSTTTTASATATSVSSQSEGSATLSAAMNGCPKSMTLTLKVKFSPVWESSYCFKLLAKEVSRADVLEARLRDCEEQLQQQKLINARLMNCEEKLQQLNDRLVNPCIVTLFKGSRQVNSWPFRIQEGEEGCGLTFTQSGLYRGFYTQLNPTYYGREVCTVRRVDVGTTLSVKYSTTIEFISDN
eukprot:scaffold365_cov119-Ochromonas_danica.AAC.1